MSGLRREGLIQSRRPRLPKRVSASYIGGRQVLSTGMFAACRLRRSTSQSISNASITLVALDTSDHDTDAMGDLSNERIVVQRDGFYLVAGGGQWAVNGNGVRALSLRKNGTNIVQDIRPGHAIYDVLSHLSDLLYLVEGDYIDMTAYQDSGAALNASSLHFAAVMVSG